MMKKKNGFVLVETLIVVLLLTVTLMSLYASFAYIVSKTKDRNNHDSIETLYKTYYVKDLMDDAYTAAGSLVKYNDSFLYYYYGDNTVWNNNNICKSYSYNTATQSNRSSNKYDDMVICDYSTYNSSSNEDAKKDPIFEPVVAYGIEKIYYINYATLAGAKANMNNYRTLMNLLDATSIDYVLEQNPDYNGDFMIIKYRKAVSNSMSHGATTALDIQSEIYHSAIAMSEVITNSTMAPLYFYSDPDAAGISTDELYADNSTIPLYNLFGSSVHPGQTLIGWSTHPEVDTVDKYKECVNGGSYYDVNKIYCYKNNSDMTVTSANRSLYAIWCGDGTLGGMLECAAVKTTTPSGSGLFSKDEDDGITTYYYSGYYGAVDDYVVYNKQCFRLISNFGNPNGIKAIFSGTYNESTGCDNKNTGLLYNKNGTYNFEFNPVKMGIQSNAYMYKTSEMSLDYLYYKKTMYTRLDLTSVHYVKTDDPKSIIKFDPDSYVSFSSKVTYDSDSDTYYLDTSESSGYMRIQWHGSSKNGFENIMNKNITNKYFCAGGGDSCKGQVYYAYYKRAYSSYVELETYPTKAGYSYGSLDSIKLLIASNVRYNASDNTYTLTGDTTTTNLSELYYSSNTYDSKLIAHPYFCLAEYKDSESDHSKNMTCSKVYKIVNAYSSYLGFAYLENGKVTDQDIINYYLGDPSKSGGEDERKIESSIKKTVDEWYANNIAVSGTNYSNIIDNTVTFCNEHRFDYGFGGGSRSNYSDNYSVRDKNYDSSYLKSKGYRNCERWDNYGTSDAPNSNGLLKYPAGLLTAAEYSFIPSADYLKIGGNSSSTIRYWLLASLENEKSYVVDTSSLTTFSYKHYTDYTATYTKVAGVRPVISIKYGVKLVSGSGTAKSPYVISN